MPWSAGVYTRWNSANIPPYWVGDASVGIKIEASRHDTQDADFEAGINACLNKDGSNTMSGNLNFGGNRPTNINAGTAAAPAICAGNDVNTGIFSPGADQIGVATNGVERVRIDSTGLVGIGTTAPSDRLHVEGACRIGVSSTPTWDTGTRLWVEGGFGTRYDGYAHRFDVGNSRTEAMRITTAGYVGIGITNPSYNLDVQADSVVAVGVAIRGRSSDNNGVLLFTNSSGIETGRIQVNSSELKISKIGANPIAFNVNGTKRLEVDGSGRVCFGGTAAVTNAGACWINSAPATEPPFISFAKTFSGSRNVLVNYHNTAYVGGIDMTNTATSFPTSSDYRLKENVVEIPNSLQRLKTLRPVRFNFISEPSQTIDGFLAHEVQEVVPNAVSGEKDEINEDGSIKVQALDHSKLVPLLTAAIKELNTKVEALEARVAELEA